MTFRESDFPDLVNRIKEIIKSEKDPMIAVQLIREIVENYEEIPLYPGIVNGVSYDLIDTADPEELEPGDHVSVEEGERHLSGQVQSIEGGTVTLNNVVECSWSNQTNSDEADVESIRKLTLGALEREWPELIFEDESGVNNR